MPRTFKGDIKLLFINSIDFNGECISNLELKDTVIKKDAEFYENFIGNIISFDLNTKLEDRMEATEYVEAGYNYIYFVDYNELVPTEYISREEFKRKKKEYKNK